MVNYMKRKGYFIAATGQNVGKTTTCLGLLAGLKKKFQDVGFIKPVGQEHIEVAPGLLVDKDVVLFKEHFGLKDAYPNMSPVLFAKGFTRDFLDGKINSESLVEKICTSYQKIAQNNEFTIVEGTGHIGVGSIANINNAKVASLLGLDVIIVVPAGLGSCIDILTLNINECLSYGVNVKGVILNRIKENKKQMIESYVEKALKRWDIPLIGKIPYQKLLSTPCMKDFEQLFQTKILSGHKQTLTHFSNIRLVACSADIYRDLIQQDQLVITPASREDIILSTLSYYWGLKMEKPDLNLKAAMILTGRVPPKKSLVEQLNDANIPVIYAPLSSYDAMKKITTYIAKIRRDDLEKINFAKDTMERHIDFDLLL